MTVLIRKVSGPLTLPKTGAGWFFFFFFSTMCLKDVWICILLWKQAFRIMPCFTKTHSHVLSGTKSIQSRVKTKLYLLATKAEKGKNNLIIHSKNRTLSENNRVHWLAFIDNSIQDGCHEMNWIALNCIKSLKTGYNSVSLTNLKLKSPMAVADHHLQLKL